MYSVSIIIGIAVGGGGGLLLMIGIAVLICSRYRGSKRYIAPNAMPQDPDSVPPVEQEPSYPPQTEPVRRLSLNRGDSARRSSQPRVESLL